MQHVATVYIQGEEYRVQAPPSAGGAAIEWLDHFSVVQTSWDATGSGGDKYASPPTQALVISVVKQELEKSSGTDEGPFYHVRLKLLVNPRVEVKFDLSPAELESRVLEPYRNLRPIVLGGRTILIETIQRLEVYEGPQSKSFSHYAVVSAQHGSDDWHDGQPEIIDVTDRLVTSPSVSTIPQGIDGIELVCEKCHTVAKQLRKRRQGRPTLDVQDEYDVQDLLHALLRIFFDDVRPEEWTPSYAVKSARMDFLLPTEKTVIEVKKSRPSLKASDLADELIVDRARYKSHQLCKRLVCFVYDPDGYVANPVGFEADLSGTIDGLEVLVIVAPRE